MSTKQFNVLILIVIAIVTVGIFFYFFSYDLALGYGVGEHYNTFLVSDLIPEDLSSS